jgi:hypothetical protein
MKRLFMLSIFLLSGQLFATPAKKEYTKKTVQVPAKKEAASVRTALAISKNYGMARSIDAIRKTVAQNSAKRRATKRTAPSAPRVIAANASKAAPARKA